MKKLLLFFVLSFFVSATAFGQISVTVTGATNTTPNLSASYTSFADALTALNGVSAMTGPVTLTLGAGGSETAPPTGFVIGSASLNPVLSASNTVTIVKSGGTVTINAGIGTATPTSAAPDGMIAIVGANYITIDGLTLTDGNVANPATMEFGIGLFKLNLSDGAQNNTIQNCTINMQRINNASGTAPMVEGSVGILVINSTNTAATTALVPDAAAGSNSNNRFYTNAINGGNYGIALSGYNASSPFTLGDTGNDIGGSSLATGNTILNFGGAPAASNPSAGVRANNQWGINISFNTVNNNDGAGVNHVSTLRGIYGQAGTSANATMNNNAITIHGGGTTSQVAALENAIGSTASSNTVNINNNTVTGDYLTATTGVFYGLFNSATAANVNMQGNSVTNMSYSSAGLAGSGVNYMIYNSAAAANVNVYNNTVNGITRTGTTGGTLIGVYLSSGTNQTVKRNTVSNLSHFGTGTGGIMYGIQTATGTIVCDSNTVHSIINNKTTGTGVLYGVYNIASPTNENYNYNTVYNISHLGTGITYGMYFNTVTGVRTVSFNNINNVNSAGTTVAGLNMLSSSPTVFGNKIYNIYSSNIASPIVSGMILGSVGTAGAANIYNNIIGDIRAAGTGTLAAPVVRGINITSATATSQVNLSNNSVYLNAPVGGANFTSTALWVTTSATATTAALTLKGNIFVNVSTPGATGSTNAYQRSNTTLTNYTSASDYNMFYAGTPGAQNLIFYDGTNSDQTLAAFKSRVTSREVNSVTENSTFLSTTASSSDFLRPDSTIATLMESGVSPTPGVTTDFRGVARYPNSGYPNNPSFPAFNADIGAFEFGGIWIDIFGPVISYTPLGTTGNTGNRTLVANIVDGTGVQTGPNGPRLYYKKSTDVSYIFDAAPSISGNDYTFTLNTTSLGGVNSGDIIQYYVAAQDLLGQLTTNPSGGSGVNPPGTTPPPAPNSYNQIATPMSGDFTVGLLLFNRVTGKNIQFETRTRKVMKEMPVQTDVVSDKNRQQTEEVHLLGQPYAEGKSVMVEVDEEYSVAVLDGKEYKGNLYYELSADEKRQHGFSDNMMGIYATITAAIADVNTRGVGATDCRFLLNDALYNTGSGETFPIIIDAAQQLPTASSRLIIKPNTGVTSTISGSSANGIIVSRAPYVVFDGTSVGSAGTRNLTISNTSGAGNTYVLGLFNNTAPKKADNNTIQYCNFTAGALVASTNATFGIILNAAGGDFDNCLIDNNSIKQVRIGMQIAGVLNATSDNVTVTNNTIGDETDTTQSCYFQGMLLSQVDNTIIEGNDLIGHMPGSVVNGASGVSTSTVCGIAMITGTTNTKIRKNVIRHWNFSGTTQGYGAKGIAYNDAANNTGTTEIVNNLIFGIKGDGDVETSTQTNMGYLPQGICIQNNGNSLFQIYYNSINMYGATLGLQFNGSSACIGVGGVMGVGTMDIRNNIFKNSMTTFSTGVGETMGIWVPSAGSNNIFSNINYNDYYIDGQFPNVGFFTTLRPTIGDWRTASGQDGNSISWDPQFVSLTNLTPQSGSIVGTAFPLASVSTDFIGNSRSTSVANGPTDMGAYEIASGTTTSMVQNIVADGVYGFGFGGTLIGQIEITGYTTPFDISWIHYSGQTPPGAGAQQYAGSYDSVWVSSGSFTAGSYSIRIYIPRNNLRNIADSNNIVLTKSDNGGATWNAAPGVGPGANGYISGYPAGYGYASGLTSFSLFAVTSSDAPLPVELSSFTSVVNRNDVKLNWTTSEESNNAGFDIERKPIGSQTWNKVGNVQGSGNSHELKNYSFNDIGMNTGTYSYRLKQIDYNGNYQYFNLSGEVIVGVPGDFKLSQNYPNPFNPTTKVDYDLPVDSKVNLRVYDMLGREVASLVNEQVTAGYYTVQLNASNLSSGTYFFRLVAQGTNGKEFVMTKKMQLIK